MSMLCNVIILAHEDLYLSSAIDNLWWLSCGLSGPQHEWDACVTRISSATVAAPSQKICSRKSSAQYQYCGAKQIHGKQDTIVNAEPVSCIHSQAWAHDLKPPTVYSFQTWPKYHVALSSMCCFPGSPSSWVKHMASTQRNL